MTRRIAWKSRDAKHELAVWIGRDGRYSASVDGTVNACVSEPNTRGNLPAGCVASVGAVALTQERLDALVEMHNAAEAASQAALAALIPGIDELRAARMGEADDYDAMSSAIERRGPGQPVSVRRTLSAGGGLQHGGPLRQGRRWTDGHEAHGVRRRSAGGRRRDGSRVVKRRRARRR